MIDNQSVGRRISQLRQQNGLTQQQLASMMNVSHQAVSKWESGMTLPDIQILLRLTQYFSVTVEELLSENYDFENVEEETISENKEEENMSMNIQQLMQMAPFMSKAAVGEVALSISEQLTGAQIARLAPFLYPETLTQLMEKHKPELSWDVVRRLAPFIGKDSVDAMIRSIANGETKVMPSQTAENLNRTINDIGKAIDDLGKGVEHAVKKTIRFGGSVISEVTNAINDLTTAEDVKITPKRSETALAIRKKAFDRALQDEKWDWIAAHVSEIENDKEMLTKITERAAVKGRHEWIIQTFGECADAEYVNKAIKSGAWEWLERNISRLNEAAQKEAAAKAKEAGEWAWLKMNSSKMKLGEDALDIAEAAYEAGEEDLVLQLVWDQMDEKQVAALAKKALAGNDLKLLDNLIAYTDDAFFNDLLKTLAERDEWRRIGEYLKTGRTAQIEELMELAVSKGDFDAIDMLDEYL